MPWVVVLQCRHPQTLPPSKPKDFEQSSSSRWFPLCLWGSVSTFECEPETGRCTWKKIKHIRTLFKLIWNIFILWWETVSHWTRFGTSKSEKGILLGVYLKHMPFGKTKTELTIWWKTPPTLNSNRPTEQLVMKRREVSGLTLFRSC